MSLNYTHIGLRIREIVFLLNGGLLYEFIAVMKTPILLTR